MKHRSQHTSRWVIRTWRLLVPIVLAFLLMVDLTSAMFTAGVAMVLFIVGLSGVPPSTWIGLFFLLFSLSGIMVAACLFVLTPDTDRGQWARLTLFLPLVLLGGAIVLASVSVPW